MSFNNPMHMIRKNDAKGGTIKNDEEMVSLIESKGGTGMIKRNSNSQIVDEEKVSLLKDGVESTSTIQTTTSSITTKSGTTMIPGVPHHHHHQQQQQQQQLKKPLLKSPTYRKGGPPGSGNGGNNNTNVPLSPYRIQNYKGANRIKYSLLKFWYRLPNVIKYMLITFTSAMITSLVLRKENTEVSHWSEYSHFLKPSSKEQRCYINRKGTRRCTCPDPTIGIPRKGLQSKEWMIHHNEMVKEANLYSKTTSKHHNNDLDFVMLGDSVVERWNGTRSLGQQIQLPVPSTMYKQQFQKLFTKDNGGTYNGLALGSSGDTGPNMLYHLQHGILQALNPKVWIIVLGSTDTFVNQCTDPYVIANILNVVHYISENRPNAKILIHGILPRIERKKRDGYKSSNTNNNNLRLSTTDNNNRTRTNTNLKQQQQQHELLLSSSSVPENRLMLGKDRKRSQTINLQLKKFVEYHTNIYYMQGGSVFLSDTDSKGRVKINIDMLEDGIHPSFNGLYAWGIKIIEQLDIIFGKNINSNNKFVGELRNDNNNNAYKQIVPPPPTTTSASNSNNHNNNIDTVTDHNNNNDNNNRRDTETSSIFNDTDGTTTTTADSSSTIVAATKKGGNNNHKNNKNIKKKNGGNNNNNNNKKKGMNQQQQRQQKRQSNNNNNNNNNKIRTFKG